ncbi:hypothetical protein VTK73DRAFT_1211 [Phialemonium thermophilum]|uniref:Uncharacterized protein n=1 Tax=Phialemonium thermophilum TaxID=223376 RepID=A0ABR3VTS3_9PEZI
MLEGRRKAKDKETIYDYVEELPYTANFFFDPVGTWRYCHGDGKSSTRGRFHIETMLGNDGLYHVRLLDRDDPVWTTAYESLPTSHQIVGDIKAAF